MVLVRCELLRRDAHDPAQLSRPQRREGDMKPTACAAMCVARQPRRQLVPHGVDEAKPGRENTERSSERVRHQSLQRCSRCLHWRLAHEHRTHNRASGCARHFGGWQLEPPRTTQRSSDAEVVAAEEARAGEGEAEWKHPSRRAAGPPW